MRLMTPTPGEAYDRLTILNLKMQHSDRPEFKLEADALITYLEDKHYDIPTDLSIELAKINARLWDLEDTQRKLLKTLEANRTDFEVFANNAITVTTLNDLRAATVQKINTACNVAQVEKLYS